MKPIKVLVLEDSIIMRESIARELQKDSNIWVCKATNAFEARDRVVAYRPDILISDIVLEHMDGAEFVRQLLPQYKIPVVMISAYPNMREKVESLGDIPFILKPDTPGGSGIDLFFKTLLLYVKALMHQEPLPLRIEKLLSAVIVMGASTGGSEALECILKQLPAILPPIVIAQHMPPKFTKSFADRLNAVSRLSVREAQQGELLMPGTAYVAPGGFHTGIIQREHKLLLQCSENSLGNKLCPCIDTLFSSAARLGAVQMLGVLLTGMGKDGAQGLLQMRQAGAHTIAQDESSCVIYGMPKAAYELGAAEYQVPLERISGNIVNLLLREK